MIICIGIGVGIGVFISWCMIEEKSMKIDANFDMVAKEIEELKKKEREREEFEREEEMWNEAITKQIVKIYDLIGEKKKGE